MRELRDLAAAALVLILGMGGALAWQQRAPAPAPVVVAKAKAHLHYEIFGSGRRLAPAQVKLVQTLIAEMRAVAARPLTIAHPVSKTMLPPDAVAVVPLPPQTMTPPDDAEAGRIAARVSAKVPAGLTPYFDTFIYVSKAASGPWAQHLYLFKKAADGSLSLDQDFAISTGRERSEQYFTATPTGLFELDVHRFVPNARSAKWNDASMPWAMFLNYSYRTQMSGVALHAAIGRHELADIGHRASGGCVRLPYAKASLFFHRFLAEERGQVPVFTFDEARGTTNTEGAFAHDPAGNVVLADGVRVLVIIDNFGGSAAPDSQS
jgi:L,D-transpeptidase-like protein